MSGMVLEYCDIKELVSQMETSADVQNRKQKIATFNKVNIVENGGAVVRTSG